jgi:hypothetical protein
VAVQGADLETAPGQTRWNGEVRFGQVRLWRRWVGCYWGSLRYGCFRQLEPQHSSQAKRCLQHIQVFKANTTHRRMTVWSRS